MVGIEQDVFVELNKLRQNPASFVAKLEQRRKCYTDKRYEAPGKPPIMTKEGVKVVDEAVNFLKTMKPLRPIQRNSNGMSLAALDHTMDLGSVNEISHIGTDESDPETRVARYGKLQAPLVENFSMGESTPTDMLLAMIVDDGVPNRVNRKNLFQPAWSAVGIAVGRHPEHDTICVLLMADGFIEGKDNDKFKERKEHAVGHKVKAQEDPAATFYLEKVTIEEEEDDDFDYEEVEEESEEEEEDDAEEEDLETAIMSLQAKSKQMEEEDDHQEVTFGDDMRPKVTAKVAKRPEVIDDFIRNYLIKMSMNKTLENFQTEWYELQQKGKIGEEDLTVVPDIYLRNQELDTQLKVMRSESEKAQEIAQKARSTWDKFRKERDFHRMHHRRVVQEKNKLIQDIRRLKNHYSKYEPTMQELKNKYETAMKEKMLMRLERDKLALRVDALEAQLKDTSSGPVVATEMQQQSTKKIGGKRDSALPSEDRVNPYLQRSFEPAACENIQLNKTFKGHHLSISSVAIHPKKPIVATGSDDTCWKMWAVPSGDLIMSGDGHKSWIGGVDFNPKGTHLATGSGDSTVKIWDFATASCSHTFTDHTQAVWDVAYHDCGDFLVSASMDHTARMFDLGSQRCRQTFRGHVDSVNSICFQPFSNNICTASSDKTVSLWDARTGLCIQTFYGHMNSCNSAAFALKGDIIASTDADGIVKLWDVRMVQEKGHIPMGPHPANKCAFDRSGKLIAVASDDGSARIFNVDTLEEVAVMKGHDDSVQDVVWDPNGNFVVSCGSDSSFRVWTY